MAETFDIMKDGIKHAPDQGPVLSKQALARAHSSLGATEVVAQENSMQP
jgi:hypothetical protein